MAKRPRAVDEVLKEAVEDISSKGTPTPEELAYWQERLRKAAQESMTPPSQMEQMLRDALTDVFRREVERGQILGRHEGVARYTIENIRPALRDELSRRIRMSAELIKLDRERAVAETLQRFTGWASGVPADGTDQTVDKLAIRKGIAGLPFRERRVLIDQSHKLSASISDVIARGGGAIAARWKSHYHQAGYDYREDHKKRDIESAKKPYLVKGSWANEQGLVKLDGSKWTDDITGPGEEVFCRCYFVYIYNLSDLPTSMLTQKGKDRLSAARKEMAR
jgi:hypothetical protein